MTWPRTGESTRAYRTQNRIVADVLAAVLDSRTEGIEPTISVVMRKSNLSHARLSRLLKQLIGNGLLQETDNRRYALSERGLQYLRSYSQFDEFALSYGLQI